MSLKQRNLSQSYVSSYLKTLKHFYNMNDLLFNWRKISKFATVSDSEQEARKRDRAYTHEEIGRMLERATLRMKAMILLLASTGMRLGALPPLKLRNMIRLADREDVYQITIYEGSKEEYITFCISALLKTNSPWIEFLITCLLQTNTGTLLPWESRKKSRMNPVPLTRTSFSFYTNCAKHESFR
jgi:integrase